MPLSRRSFVQSLSAVGAGLLSAPLITSRGREAWAAETRRRPWHELEAEYLGESARVIRLSSNENPRGPSQAALDGIRDALGEASRYPFDAPEQVRRAIAEANRVPVDHVILGCGSTEILRMAVDAFTSRSRHLVTAAPTFEEAADRASVLGVRVDAVPVDAGLRLDLGVMAAKSPGAGLVFVNNPNNPTGTLHSARAIQDFVRKVLAASPQSTILIDEAYHEYVEDPSYATAIPLAMENPRVMVARTFSKVYGLAGLRVGYAIARPETIQALAQQQLGMSVNVLGASAARAALADRELPARERALNREAREFTRAFFDSAGFRVARSHANFIMADIRRDSRQFQLACAEHDVRVGRPFPPLTTHARVSIGTMDEMRAAVEVFRKVLKA